MSQRPTVQLFVDAITNTATAQELHHHGVLPLRRHGGEFIVPTQVILTAESSRVKCERLPDKAGAPAGASVTVYYQDARPAQVLDGDVAARAWVAPWWSLLLDGGHDHWPGLLSAHLWGRRPRNTGLVHDRSRRGHRTNGRTRRRLLP